MDPKSPKLLDDIIEACAFVGEATADTTLTDYARNRLLRYAIERNFEIIGEALLRLERTDPATAARISDYRSIIGLRNRLVHGYDSINDARVWEIVQDYLPVLRREVDQLLREVEER
jgi:uncharacterized protein with HEPN domain